MISAKGYGKKKKKREREREREREERETVIAFSVHLDAYLTHFAVIFYK